MNKKSEKLKKTEGKLTYVFIDATNIIYGAKRLGWKVDFKKLYKYLKERCSAEKILYYGGVDDENKKQLKFYEKLAEFGYLLRLIPVKRFLDGSKKADVDSRMTFEMMLLFKDFDNAIIMTGDGDYYWVLEYLVLKKKEIHLLSHRKSTARELKRVFGEKFIDLQDVKNIIEFAKKTG